MKKSLKAVISLVLALMLVLSLAACNSGSGSSSAAPASSEAAPASSEAAPADSSEAAPAESSEAAPADDGGDTAEGGAGPYIWEMTWGNADNMALWCDQLTADYKEAFGKDLTVEVKSWDGYMETYSTAIASGTAPDVATAGGCQVGLYHAAGELLDLNPIVDAWKAENNPILDDFNEITLSIFNYEDQLAAFCFGIDAKIMVYRRDFLEQAGYTGKLDSLEEFRKALEMCKEAFPDKEPLCAPGNGTGATHNMAIFLGWFDTGYTDKDLNPCMSTGRSLECLQFVSDLYKDGLIGEGDAAYMSDDALRVFSAGEAVFVLGQNTGNLRDLDFFDQCEIVAPPEGVAEGCPNPVFCFANSANNKVDPQPTYDYLKWWMEEELLDYFIVTGHSNFPTRASFYDDPYYKDEPFRVQCWDRNVSVCVAEVYPYPAIYPAFLQVDGELYLSKCFQRLIMGEDPATVGAETDALIQDAIDTYN